MSDKFAAFILTHGRSDNVITYATLRRYGYTGKIYIIIDNEDAEQGKYIEKYGDQVIIFDKLKIAGTFDTGDNFDDRRTIVYARNACFEIAQNLGIKYFIQLDDDYNSFRFTITSEGYYADDKIYNLDKVFEHLLNFYKSIPAHSIAIAQSGDFIGGKDGSFGQNMSLRRKCMNSFICSTNRPFKFVGRINEDVNSYTRLASTGTLFLTVPILKLYQSRTQTNDGGMTNVYLDSGTYIKSFYSVMFHPSSVTISFMGYHNRRLHHRVSWKNTVPMILDERYRK